MSQPLIRILYVSRLTAEAAADPQGTMRDILRASHANNRRDHLTGFLWSDGEVFTQVFEGPGEAADDLFARLLLDRRHEDVRLRLYREERARAFPRWTMCGLTLSDLDEALLAPADIEPDLFAIEPGAILAMLTRIAAAHGDRLDAAHSALMAG